MTYKSKKARDKACEYFGLKPGDGLVLHHVDQTLRHTNRERYNEWRPEDLIVVTKAEHNRIHSKGKKLSEEHKNKISEAHMGKTLSEETKAKISAIKKGTMHSKETREKISKANKGQVPWIKGRKHSEESKKKMSESMIGKNAMPVCQYTLDGEFVKEWPSMRDADAFGFCHVCIGKVCKGKWKSHKGYKWAYKNPDNAKK